MSAEPIRILFASRAHESAHTEGGYLLLKDLAARAAGDPAVDVTVFSSSKERDTRGGVNLLPAFSRGGWGLWPAVQFARSLLRWAATFDIVHTAHVPTSTNTSVLRQIRRRATPGGTRFVQTVTALPERGELRRELFWGDAVVCLNAAAASEARQFHDKVLTIAPAVRPERLQDRPRMPADIAGRFAGQKVVCIPVDLGRVSEFDLQGLCESLLASRDDLIVVFPCRFGEEQMAEEYVAALSQAHTDRVHIFATIDWVLDLLAASDVVAYPITDTRKKFNPPLVLLEAAQLGTRIVTTSSVLLDSAGIDGGLVQLESSEIGSWTAAVCEMIDSQRRIDRAIDPFDDIYSKYASLYRTLLDGSD
jgi:hypothetical protein